MLSFSTALLTVSLQSSPAPLPQAEGRLDPPRARIAIPLQTPGGATFEDLQGLDLLSLDVEAGRATALAVPRELEALTARGIEFVVESADEQARYAARLAASGPVTLEGSTLAGSLVPPFAQGSMGGYWTWDEVVSVLDQLHAAFPNITTPKFSIGQSLQGRDIWAIKVSDSPDVDEDEPEVRYDSMHHSREPQGMQTSFWFLIHTLENYGTDPLSTYLVDERELFFIPVVNPDGYVFNQQIEPGGGGLWRKNRRNNGDGTTGVDLNRNYPFQWGFDDFGSSPFGFDETFRGPSPASEPETQAMIAFIQARDFGTALSIHTFSDVWIQPFNYADVQPFNQPEWDELNGLCTEVNGYFAGNALATLGSLANGSTIDWETNLTGAFSWTPEIGSQSDGFWPPASRIVPLAEANLLAFQRVALAGGALVYADSLNLVEVGDGDGFVEAGEQVELDLAVRNAGVDPTTGPVTATLIVETPNASVLAGQVDLGGLNSFEGADTGSTPLAFAISGAAQPGDVASWRVVLSYEGFDQELSGSLPIGAPRALVVDDAEQPRGWTTGLPSDTASTGLWERAVPDGTTSGSEPANPGADTTPGGQFAYVTGNGGGSGGNDDVDDGLTTLLSPRIDLSGAAAASLRYQRWHADLSVADDVFRVDVSNDDGQTWIELEALAGNQNQWLPFEAQLQTLLPLTDSMRLRFIAQDDPNNSVVEAAVDDLAIDVFGAGPLIAPYGQAAVGQSLRLFANAEDAAQAFLFAATTALPAPLAIPGVSGALELDPATAFELATFGLIANGAVETVLPVPNNPSLAGLVLELQAVTFDTGGVAFSNRVTVVID